MKKITQVAKMPIVHRIISYVTSQGWLLQQIDVKNAFLMVISMNIFTQFFSNLKSTLHDLKQITHA